MDWVSLKSNGLDGIKKYRYVLLVVLAGIFLMTLPEGRKESEEPQQTIETTQPVLQDSLAEILSQIAGAGKVKVLLTEAAGEQTIYQTDEDHSSSDIRRQTVLVTNSSREETGLVRQINPPTYQGAIILCQGADSAAIRLSIVEAVANATGLSTDKISVLKMK